MLVPLSWLREFVETDLPAEELARKLTLAGLEVEALRFVGLPVPSAPAGRAPGTSVSGLAWDRDKFVVWSNQEKYHLPYIECTEPDPRNDKFVEEMQCLLSEIACARFVSTSTGLCATRMTNSSCDWRDS